MKKYNHIAGFTLIELMIVIAIIAILISYALPAYRDYTVRTKLSEGSAMASAYKIAVNEAFVRNGTLDGLNNDSFGIPGSSARGYCVDTIEVSDGEITVSYNCLTGEAANEDPFVDISEIVWSPSRSSSNTLLWTCIPNTPRPDQDPCA